MLSTVDENIVRKSRNDVGKGIDLEVNRWRETLQDELRGKDAIDDTTATMISSGTESGGGSPR